jgi:uncharacterized membrane protein
MNDFALAFGIGAISGSRSMLGPTLVGHLRLPAAAQRALTAMAAGEMVADKLPWIPARTDSLPLAGRIGLGALAAAAAVRRDRRLIAGIAGAAGALVGTYAWYHLRRAATHRLGVPGVAAGLAEDALATAAGTLLLRGR